jgi:hypothetical protein
MVMSALLPLLLLLGFGEGSVFEPMLVVVEAGPSEVIKTNALRESIARELGVPVLAPGAGAAPSSVAIMTIWLALDRAVVTYGRGGATIRREIALPPDESQRMLLVTWLAGNIVRDQTAELLPRPPAVVATSPPAVASPQPPWRAEPGTPPVLASSAPPTASVATGSSAGSSPGPGSLTVAAMIGRGIFDPYRIKTNGEPALFRDLGGQSELEIMHSGASFTVGGTILWSNGRAEGITIAWHRRPRPWIMPELGATAGLWSIESRGGSLGFTQTTDLFFRLTAALALSPAPWLDILPRMSVLGPMSSNAYLVYASIGLRYRFPLH